MFRAGFPTFRQFFRPFSPHRQCLGEDKHFLLIITQIEGYGKTFFQKMPGKVHCVAPDGFCVGARFMNPTPARQSSETPSRCEAQNPENGCPGSTPA